MRGAREAPPAERGGAGLEMTLLPPVPMSLSKQRMYEEALGPVARHGRAERARSHLKLCTGGCAGSTPILNYIHVV